LTTLPLTPACRDSSSHNHRVAAATGKVETSQQTGRLGLWCSCEMHPIN
jgi:hypothetical protein